MPPPAFRPLPSALFSMRSLPSIIAAPTLCLLLLAGIVWDNGRHARPADAEPFHRAAGAAVAGWPRAAGDWRNAKDDELPLAAVQLLKPNGHFYRVYAKPKATGTARRPGDDAHRVGLLVIQCRDPEDMSGHYPPNCYPRNGSKMDRAEPRAWRVPGLAKPITGVAYRFRGGSPGEPETRVIYNFFILPGRGIVPEMDAVRRASGDYQRKHFGATQVQVIFNDPDLDQDERDQAFVDLMTAGVPALTALEPAGI